MASFTDLPPQFTPYTPQLPVEAMVKVGMQKQALYDQGVQKIQAQIEQVAGMDVAKDVHKNYLQSKLNELGNNLKTFAASDFSNYQLVNSVGGMTKQIVKDPTIQNAVSSTQKLRKGQKDMEAAKKAGKSSIQNEAWFNNDASNWLNDGDLNSSFSGEFIQYTDIEKKLREVAEKIHEYDNSVEIPFKRDNKGNILYYKKDPVTGKTSVSIDPNSGGTTKIDDAMLSIKTKGKSADKILANFYDSLDENDMRQLRIDGWYHYRGATTQTFLNDAKSNYEQNRKMLSDKIVTLNTELQTNSKLTQAEKSKIKALINDTDTVLSNGSLEKELQKQYNDITDSKDIEDYKYKLYTQKTLTNLAKDISYQDVQQEYKSNPYAQMDMEKRRLQFQYDDAKRQQKNWERDFAWKKSTWYADQLTKAKDAAGSQPIVTPDRLSTDVDKPDLEKLDKEITAIAGDPSKGITGTIDQLNAQYAPTLADKSLKTPEQKLQYLNNLASAYATDPSSINSIKDPNVREYLERRRGLDIILGQKRNLYASTVNASKSFDDQLNKVFSKDLNLVNTKTGKVIFSAKDIYEVAKDIQNFTVGAKFNYQAFREKYKGTRKENIATAYIKNAQREEAIQKGIKKPGANAFGEIDAPELTSTERSILEIGASTVNNRDASVNEINKQKLEFQSNYLAQRMPERQLQVGTLSKDNKADMDHVNMLIGNKFNEFASGGVDIRSLGDFDPDKIAEIQKDPNAKYTIRKKYDGSAELILASGSDRQTIPMTSGEFAAFFPNYHKNNPVNEIKYAVLASPNHTTNLVGGNDASAAVNAYMSGYDLPNLANTIIAPLVRLDVEGSPFNDGGANDKYSVRMYVNDNGQWKTDILTQKGYVTEAGVQQIINNIGAATVSDLLKKNP